MYHVLVPVDTNTERAREQAAYLTSRPVPATADVTATVLHVHPRENPPEHAAEGTRSVDAVVTATEALTDGGYDVERVVRTGQVTEEILADADEHDVDEIVVGGRERPGMAKGLIGSTSKDLLQSCDRPLVVTD